MAEQEEPVRRRVALKVIKLGMDTKEVIARFEAERQALALMDHPNIAKVLDAGATETGRPYFVMELVRGIKITDYCDQHHLPTEERLKLFTQVCQAIQHAHQKGIIHRDIKPSNVLVTVSEPGAPGCPKVIDFGIAKATTSQRLTDKTVFTAFEQFIGTPAYMSPEQVMMTSLDIDTRTDIYALGVLLYELLTGKTPFDARELMAAGLDEIRRTIREVEPPKPSTRLTQELVAANVSSLKSQEGNKSKVRADSRRLLQEVRGDLDWIVMKCLEKDRTRRYDTANGLAADLRRHLENEPVTARPPSSLYRFQKTVRRNKLAFGATAAIVTVLVFGVAVSTWQAVRAIRAEHAATIARAAAEKARQNESGLRQTAQTEANRADAAASEANVTLSASDFLQAVRLIADDNANDALPYLARSVSVNPANSAALTRLTTLLTYHSWMLPTLIFGGTNRVSSVEFSPDGERILTAGATDRVWDAQTGQPLTEPVKHRSPDKNRRVTTSQVTVRVVDAQTGQPLTPPMMHSNVVIGAQFSPDETRILTTTGDASARVWDALTGQPLTPPMKHPKIEVQNPKAATSKGNIYSENSVGYVKPENGSYGYWSRTNIDAQFSPDGKQIVTVAFNTALVWDAQTGQPLTQPLRHGDEVSSAQFTSDGKRILTALQDHTARVWDAQTGESLTEPMKHGGKVVSVQSSPDGNRIVTASDDQTARVWDASSGHPLSELLRHREGCYYAEFSPDGQFVVTASADATARIWPTPLAALPTPAWLPELAEALAGRQIDDKGSSELVPVETLFKLTQRIGAASKDAFTPDYYSDWALIFLAETAPKLTEIDGLSKAAKSP